MGIDNNAKLILDLLEQNGFEAYVVGGCVRDFIMGIEPKDWDITTNATSDEIKSTFSGYSTIPTGEKHGTITVVIDEQQYEVTTYRIDGEYTDSRHCDVQFTTSIKEDLSRRDFTINAIAYNPKTGYVDPFNGIYDIRQRIVRCVGSPVNRLTEDPLRILRGFRFALKYDFRIDSETYSAMTGLSDRLDKISYERIRDEFKQILIYGNSANIDLFKQVLLYIIPELKLCMAFDQMHPYHIFNVFDHIIYSVLYTRSFESKLCMLLHDIGKPETFSISISDITKKPIGHFYGHATHSVSMANTILKRLRFDNDTINKVCAIITRHDYELESTPTIKRLSKLAIKVGGYDNLELLLACKHADISAQHPAYYAHRADIINANTNLVRSMRTEVPINVTDLKISGDDVMEILDIKPSKVVGDILKACLDFVISNPKSNTYSILKEYVKINFK